MIRAVTQTMERAELAARVSRAGKANEAMNVVEVSGISKSFKGIKVVDSVSFSIGQSEIFGMVGPNGAGKTTTIRMLMDIIKPDSGEIKILGEPKDTFSKI